jgi:hypothetical protein
MLAGEWVLGCNGERKERWVRIEKSRWRNWCTRKRGVRECDVVIEVDDVEWVAFR